MKSFPVNLMKHALQSKRAAVLPTYKDIKFRAVFSNRRLDSIPSKPTINYYSLLTTPIYVSAVQDCNQEPITGHRIGYCVAEKS